MTTPSKRSMERAEEALGPCVNELGACPHCVLSKEVALAFDKLVEEAATLSEDTESFEGSWIAKEIRLKLKGGEDV